ncbi:hypothetical protein DEO72_LG6g2824 [Vigna unguiculata]|uniref:Uncharacterized protein n=1 Tax=Vigna unguiculata TaxID=3917 RepID=A0A4D6MAV5_VIGUN|nr:hypothetical protein DEO72_LG6g2824 [Vigna unguiculata]
MTPFLRQANHATVTAAGAIVATFSESFPGFFLHSSRINYFRKSFYYFQVSPLEWCLLRSRHSPPGGTTAPPPSTRKKLLLLPLRNLVEDSGSTNGSLASS